MRASPQQVVNAIEKTMRRISNFKRNTKLTLRDIYDLAKYLGDEKIEYFAEQIEANYRAIEPAYDRIYKFLEKLLDTYKSVW